MQIREITLKELETVYSIIVELYTELTYEAFEDLIYDMRHMEYKMIGIFERDELVCYAGIAVQTSLQNGRFLAVYDLVTQSRFRRKGYGQMMLEYLQDYAKMAACTRLIVSNSAQSSDAFCRHNGLVQKECNYVKEINY